MPDSTSETIINALQEGAESVLPKGITTSVRVAANFPQAIEDAQEALKNAKEISVYAALAVIPAKKINFTNN